MITGVDLVQSMLLIAGGERLPYRQSDIATRGHAIEVRINAEDPSKQFMPSPGRVVRFRAPEGGGVRFDTMVYEGYVVPPFYDSLLGKLIVVGDSREAALRRLRTALENLSIEGVATTRGLHLALLGDEDILRGAVHTRWLEDWLPSNLLGIGRAA
jgi:acetyl-CoA carboxylase biotin carboxylase subunit